MHGGEPGWDDPGQVIVVLIEISCCAYSSARTAAMPALYLPCTRLPVKTGWVAGGHAAHAAGNSVRSPGGSRERPGPWWPGRVVDGQPVMTGYWWAGAVPARRSLRIASISGQLGSAPEGIGLDEDRRRSPITRSTSTPGSTPRPAQPQRVLDATRALLPEEGSPRGSSPKALRRPASPACSSS